MENGGRSLLARITIIQCSYLRGLTLSLRPHPPLVYMKFVARIDSHPQHLISDRACECEINRKKCDSLILAKGCQHICLPKSKHYSLCVPEKAIGDPDRNTRAVMTDANIPPLYWDITVEHVALLNAYTSVSFYS